MNHRGVGPAMREAVERLVNRREALFGCTKRVNGNNREKELKPHMKNQSSRQGSSSFCFTSDPHTRYAVLPSA
eukprot:CAMPEP_0174745498 /NCGR_PEP_ID=MMETSP1094-20130205/86917_1 /TAXON_ID=156173 /ORGANISM="Chrysochromulina brevifilum, Strain UTEX LB 985" /LENGTH=72 /DNA_ID=CAMNT_0015950053 /DNA_START=60 /DNA_END=274 /DNA_ORIENTATION=+